jgi:hypothetical protein
MLLGLALLMSGCAAKPEVYEPNIRCDVSDAYRSGVKCHPRVPDGAPLGAT